MCMKYRAICFDFDYTLGDSTDSIVAGFQYGFTRLGWPAPDRETVRRTVGYLLEDAYTLLTGDRDPEHRAAFRPLFLEASMERQRRETTLFPGAPELLRELKARGILHHKVVFSPELPARTMQAEAPPPGRRSVPASAPWVPPVAGFLLAGAVIQDLIQV